MDENQEILHRITEMAEEERSLRDSLGAGDGDGDAERARLGDLERELDQCWDLLRQRKAMTEFGQNPDDAQARPQSVVEHYVS
ncbi:DUF2630 family protein [Streptomyces sp. NBC_01176]|uniref:DUF2630 family protein n=1 Tax=Streptomyces sp. NBC_01176 TaxID=2903760 RepID=UPI002F91970A|nr:DUF2630 family protein [Streptomyces sp. NBC_01176]